MGNSPLPLVCHDSGKGLSNAERFSVTHASCGTLVYFDDGKIAFLSESLLRSTLPQAVEFRKTEHDCSDWYAYSLGYEERSASIIVRHTVRVTLRHMNSELSREP